MEDGFDYMGHARGGVQSRTVDSGCTCAFGKLKQQKPAIKKMCRNCKHCQGIYCHSKKKQDTLSAMFQMPNQLEIKDLSMSCDCWELSPAFTGNIDYRGRLTKRLSGDDSLDSLFFLLVFFVVTVWGIFPRQLFFCWFFSCWLHGQQMRLLDLLQKFP